MSSTISRVLVLSFAVLLVTGCASSYVTKARYDQDVQSLKDYIEALERRNADLQARNEGLEQFARGASLVSAENEFYAQIARNIQNFLDSSGFAAEGEASFDAKKGMWTLSDQLLFNSGSYIISDKGRTFLKAFADGYKSKDIRFRIVGHTDRDPIARASTKKNLETDTNLELSVKRATAVFEALLKAGVSEKSFILEGHGNNNPVAVNDKNPSNKAKNRRVEIYVLGEATGK